MKYETFEKLILELEIVSKRYSMLYDLGVDLMNYDEPIQKINSLLMLEVFGKEGKDWVEWYLYERQSHSGEVLKAWDKDENEICYDIKSLWKEITQ